MEGKQIPHESNNIYATLFVFQRSDNKTSLSFAELYSILR